MSPPSKRSFYEALVHSALTRVAESLDEALDFPALADRACLSPLHFHRIFRTLTGETALELHRRLRLERAALRLAQSDTAVTVIAFEAGYETHESFTRAFREAYGASPSEFRGRQQNRLCAADHRIGFRLASPINLHIDTPLAEVVFTSLLNGGTAMKVSIESMDEIRVACVEHRGPYNTIHQSFGKLGAIAGPAGLFEQPEAMMIGIYYDDPESTPAAELRSDAGIVIKAGTAVPAGLIERKLAAGEYAKTTHIGPYDQLGDAWARLLGQWLPASGRRLAPSVAYELYRNDPSRTEPARLHTDLYAPLEPSG